MLAPSAAQAQFAYTTNGGAITITGYTGPGGAVAIPATISGLTVTGIGASAFSNCLSFENITIASSVTNVGVYAFCDCTNLTNITIPGSLIHMPAMMFANCTNLASVFFEGDPPTFGSGVFAYDTNATIYYLPGTDWGSPFAGVPTALWNPLIQTGDGHFGVQNNQFGFNITGTTNIPIVVEACTNLANPVWIPLTNVTLTNGLFYFSDPQWTNYPARYYGIGFQ